ncbi:hypothetical protein ACHAXT_010051 [Thalassiosira profunda]
MAEFATAVSPPSPPMGEAVTLPANFTRESPDEYIAADGHSGESPPPPERKYSSDVGSNSPSGEQHHQGSPVRRGQRDRPTKFNFYVPENTEKGIDPPEKELPTYMTSGNMTSAEESARKAQSRLIALQHRESRSSRHNVTNAEGPSGGDIARPVRRRTKSGSSLDMLTSIADRNSDSEEEEEDVLRKSLNDIDGADDDDHYPNMNMDPVESDDEGNYDSMGHNVAGMPMNQRGMPPMNRHGMVMNHQGQPMRYGSPVQNRQSDPMQYMKQHPSSAPQHGRQKMNPQQMMQFLHAGRGSYGGGGPGPQGMQGMPGVAPLPFGRGGPGRGTMPSQQQQGVMAQHVPWQGPGKHPGGQRQHPQQGGPGGKAQSFHGQPQHQPQMQSPMQSGMRPSRSFQGQRPQQPQGQPQRRQARRGSNQSHQSHHSQQQLYSDGIHLLEKAASEARERDEADTLRDGIDYLRNLETALEGAPPGAMGARKGPPPPPPPPGQLNRSHRPPPKMQGDGIRQSRSYDAPQGGSGNAGGPPQRVHRPPPPRQPSGPTTPTQARNRPVITAAAAIDYVMSAGAISPEEYTESPLSSIGDAERIGRGVADMNINEEDAGDVSVEGMMPRKTSLDKPPSEENGSVGDDDFEKNTSLSMHAEAKSGAAGGAPSRYAEDKHGSAEQFHNARQGSFDPPEIMQQGDDVHDGEGLAPSVRPMRTMNERLYAVEAVIPTPTRYDEEFADEIDPFEGAMPHLAQEGGVSHALGPRSKRPGGITGVVLDASSPEKSVEHRHRPPSTTSSSSEGSGTSSDDDRLRHRALTEDPDPPKGVTRAWSGDVGSDGGIADPKSTALMMNLCSHLLPAGLDSSFSSLFEAKRSSLAWDDDDPDEPGYIVHRLTHSELVDVENAFEGMVKTLERTSGKGLRDNNKNFERDLEEAEMILDQEERRFESEVGRAVATNMREDGQDLQVKHREENDTLRESVKDFPGIYPPGQGRPGEMECFYLPIITKSQKTGFEPTKDLVLKPGSVFANNYLVQSELGSAAFSTAYRCLDLSSEEDEDGYQDEVCLKVIKNTKDYFDQSLDEIKILQLLKDTNRVQDNNVVEMKTFFYHREHLVIVTELLRQNLYEFGKSIIESQGAAYFTRLRLSHITRQCLVALKFVHELGLMHCDIKPENILLSSYSRALVKVIDFGSSSFVTDRQSSYIQSRSYRAPEVILGLPYGGKIDMWSLGCVVAELYTNEVTFQNDSELSMLSRIEAVCGTFPRHMIAKGRNSHRIFTDSGLIYEKTSTDEDVDESNRSGDDDDNSDKVIYNVFQPKMTTVAARLGFAEDFMDQPNLSEDDQKRALFIDFVSKLLTIDPDARPTAAEALDHPWITSSLDLTEEDIRYGQ